MNALGPARRTYLVRPYGQLRLAMTVAGYVVLYSAVLGLAVFLPLYKELGSAGTAGEKAVLEGLIQTLRWRFLAGVAVVAAIVGVHVVFLSHRFAGPVKRFNGVIDALCHGDHSRRIRLRQKDEFKETAELLNRLSMALGRESVRCTQFHQDIRAKMENLDAMLTAEGMPYHEDVNRLIREILKGIEEYERHR